MFHDLGPDFWKAAAAFSRTLCMAAWALGGCVVASHLSKFGQGSGRENH